MVTVMTTKASGEIVGRTFSLGEVKRELGVA
jgi:hypothetical protein